jgi:acyl-CoA reductase-like NAD-dependent aldehyde dehydrogenase
MSTDTAAPTNPPRADVPHEVVVTCPATGKVVGRVPVSTSVEVEAVAARLRAAQPAWQRIGVEGRSRWLGKWRDWLLDHADELLTVLQLETGKSWGDASIEIAGMESINYWIDKAGEFLADQTVRPYGAANAAKKLTIAYEPYPLVGVITPWNGPLLVPLVDIAPALMAGCAVLSKPSEVTPLVWRMAVDGWKQIGAPDVLDAVFGFGQTGAALVDLVDYVMFTGSVNTGRRIAVAAAQRLIPYSLELGGKDAMIVCADADIDRAAGGAVWGAFTLAGQVCISVERCYVEEPVYDEFVSKVVAKTSQLRQGMDAEHDYSCEVGSMTTAQQLAIVSGHVDDAVSKGARVLVGGKSSEPAEGLFYQPTVLVDVDHGMKCMREETFGPTLPIMKVRDVAEAIEKANDSELGLAGSVWTRDKNKGRALARKMNTGTVNINNVIASSLSVPMEGWNDSGVGSRSGGADGIRKYCRTKSIVAERVAMKKEPLWYPYSRKKGKTLTAMLRMTSARDWRRRLGR